MIDVRVTRSVLVERACGPALFEIRRMCAQDVRVDIEDQSSNASDCIATLRFVGTRQGKGEPTVLTIRSAPLAAHASTPHPTILLSLDNDTRWRATTSEPAEHYSLAHPRERLAMLARLATLCRPESWQQPECLPLAQTPIHAQVMAIQLSFGLHMTERDLCARLGIDPATLRRWFSRAGELTPVRAMCWVRMHSLASRLVARRASIEHTAHGLGFPSPANVRRTLRALAGVAPGSLRREAGFARFVTLMANEFRE